MATSIGDNTKARKKRPSETGTLVGTRFQADLLSRLDEWRRAEFDLPSRPEAVRRLVEKGLGSD
jgi:hypothetical protein